MTAVRFTPVTRLISSSAAGRLVLWVVPIAAAAAVSCDSGYVELGDLPAIRERGELRILVPRQTEPRSLPRRGAPGGFERDLAEQFAISIGLEPRMISVANREELIPDLLAGRGDVVAAGLTVTPERGQRIAFSAPLDFVREQVVTRLADTTLHQLGDLDGRTITVRRSSSYWHTAERLRRDYPGLALDAASERLSTEELLYRVSQGEIDLTIADDRLVDDVLGYIPELRAAFDVTEASPMAWAMRPDAVGLRAAADSFLASHPFDPDRPARLTGDLEAIRDRRVLRVLTRNSAATYFVWRGQLLGFEYDLARRFAERMGVRLEIVVPPTRANLISWLRQGYGDIVAAGLTPSPERESQGVSFGPPYHYVIQTVVARAADTALHDPSDLEGRTLVVRRRSSYWPTAQRLRAEIGINVEIEPAPEEMETEEIIDRVAEGAYDLTIADSHILGIDLTWRNDVRGAFTLGDSVPHAWATRTEDTLLVSAIDAFVREEYRGLWFNLTYNKYFVTAHRVMEQATERTGITGTISPYDSLIKHHAAAYGFDWRLIAAQAYEESRFDPTARSYMGALGLMQVMPTTGRAFGYEDLTDPAVAVEAGVHYLRQQYDLFEGRVDPDDQVWFALAAYNAGYGHVEDARRLAPRLDYDPRRWFDSMDRVMPLLARSEYHQNARYGYCRCQEPVNYVGRIRERYRAYSEILAEDSAAQP